MTSVCIIAGGEGPSYLPEAFFNTTYSIVICADSGADTARRLGITPTLIIGDLDSISDEARRYFEGQGIQFLAFATDKDKTDLNLALDYAVSQNATEIGLIGFRGGRIDHEIGNLLLLTSPTFRDVKFTLYDTNALGYLVLESKQMKVIGQKGDVLSIVAVGSTKLKLSTRGLKWNMSNDLIELGSSKTLSNCLIDPLAIIEVHEGSCFVFHFPNNE